MLGNVLNNTVLEYDPLNGGAWKKINDLPSPRVGFTLNVLGDLIYATGGHSNNGTISIIDVYDTVMDDWIEQIEMPKALSWHSTSVHENSLLVFGGCHFWNGLNFNPIALDFSDSVFQIYPLGDGKFVSPSEVFFTTQGWIKTQQKLPQGEWNAAE